MNQTEETLKLLKDAQSRPNDELAKAYTQPGSPTSGLIAYDLEAPAKTIYPVLTPLRNATPRINGGRGTQANWRAIIGINTAALETGVSEGNRGGTIATSTADYMAMFRGLGLEDYVTFEADYAAQGFDDVRARAVQNLLRALMIGEEKVILGGNASVPLGTTPTPTLVASASGGTLSTQTLSVICVALAHAGYLTGSIAVGVRGQITRTNADGSQDTYGGGAARKSTAASVSVTGPTGSVSASVTAVTGAAGYAWFWGAGGSEVLGAITTINSLVIVNAAVGTQTAASLGANDNSTNSLVFDGLLTQIVKSGSNAYVKTMATGTPGAGTPITSDGTGGIVEIDAALQSFWDNWRLSPTTIWVSSQEQKNISKKILASAANAAQRFTFNVDPGMISGGVIVRSYLNKFAMDGAKEIPIKLHPNMPAGTLMFDTDLLPYPLSGVANVKQIRTRRDYYQLEWPVKTRRYEYGVYVDEVLQNYFPPAFGVIANIADG